MAKIETYSTPQRLFRYRPLVNIAGASRLEQELDAITGSYIFCPSFKEMNDPMEGLLRPSRLFKEDLDTFHIKSAQVLKEMEKVGIAAFSEAYNHEPMWAHYAGQFDGICIAYNVKRLLASLTGGALVRMNYSEQAPMLLANAKRPAEMARVALSMKNYRWMGEREWRLFSPHRGKLEYSDPSVISQLYFGSRVSSEDRKRIAAGIRAMPNLIPMFRMSINGYEMKFTRILRRVVVKKSRN